MDLTALACAIVGASCALCGYAAGDDNQQTPDARRLMDAAGPALILLDGAGRPRLLNRTAETLLEGAGSRTLLRILRGLLPSRADRRRAVAALRRILSGATAGERLETAADDRRESLLVSMGASRAADGRIEGALMVGEAIGNLRVINAELEQYAANLEQMIFERTRDLARSEEKYRELFDASPDLYLVVSAGGRVEEVNRTMLRLTGHRREDLTGRRFLRFLSPAARRAVWTALPGFIEHGVLENLEFQLPRRGGPPLQVIVNAVAGRTDDGRLGGARVVLRDITHRAQLARQLSLSERLAATGKLAAGVAHEINNPLQAVLVHLSLVEGQLGPDFPERDSFVRVREGIRRIQQIVMDLLDLHRGAEQDAEPVDVNHVLCEALGLVQTPLRHRRITTHVDAAADVPRVTAIARHVYQVVLNLVLNAMEAMPRGGVLSVRTRYVPGADEVEIDIADTGAGIPEQLLAHIFDPFLTTSGKRGSGLGLFVTYGLVRQHGGRIQVDSAPNRGSTVRVYFPVRGPAGRGASRRLEVGSNCD